jgi:hypothetical protein
MDNLISPSASIRPVDLADADIDSLKHAVEGQCGGAATFVRTELVWELLKGELINEHFVHIFGLTGHPEATTAYAWSSQGRRGLRRFVVLHLGKVTGPDEAVRAMLLAE